MMSLGHQKRKSTKVRHEYERSPEVLDAYKTEHNVQVEREEEEEEEEQQEEEEEEAQQPKQDLQFIEMYNGLVPEGYFMSMEAI